VSTATEHKTDNKSQAHQDLEWVNLSELQDDPDNLREEYDGIEELMMSIRARGLLQPIVVRRNEQGEYVIKAGHRRKRALVLAGLVQTRVLVDSRAHLAEDVIADMLIENGHRKDLNPMEQAFGLSRIRTMLTTKKGSEATYKEVGDYVGRNQVFVSDRLNLLGLTTGQQQAVRDGRMTLGEGVRLGKISRGTLRPGAKGKKSAGYFTSHHPLAKRAERRCKASNHKPGGPNYMNIACCKCWEHVIRQAAVEQAREEANRIGNCSVCGSQVEGVNDSDQTGSEKATSNDHTEGSGTENPDGTENP
jgi:ParB/RepB/Spo0J family partition protein